MLDIINLSVFIAGTIAVVLVPGPNSMYVLSVAARRGVRSGYAGACGIFVGDAILMLLAVLGAAAVLRTAPLLFAILKTIGGVYLAYLGFKMLQGAWRIYQQTQTLASHNGSLNATPVNDSGLGVQEGDNPFVKALAISLINPKAILFFVSFFVQFVRPDAVHPYWSFLVLGLILQFFSFCYLTLLIFAGSQLAAAFRARPLWQVLGLGTVGLLFVGFGAKLATASMEG